MPRYNYFCTDCLNKAVEAKGQELSHEEFLEASVFETIHGFHPSEEELHEARECPRCEGHNTELTAAGAETYGYVRGYGWSDKRGIKRDMNLHKMTTTDENGKPNDPYGHMRQPGEADDLAHRLRKGGTRSGVIKQQVFDVGGSQGKKKKK